MPEATAIPQTATEREGEERPQTMTVEARAPRILERHYEQLAARHYRPPGPAEQTIGHGTSVKTQAVEIDDLPEDLPGKLLSREPYIVSFSPLQEWEGYVIAISDDQFKVRLVSITGGPTSDTEEVALPISDLSQEERGLLKLGAVLRWVIGYEITKSGRRRKASQIVVRQLPKWTKRELEEAMREGQKLAEKIKWD